MQSFYYKIGTAGFMYSIMNGAIVYRESCARNQFLISKHPNNLYLIEKYSTLKNTKNVAQNLKYIENILPSEQYKIIRQIAKDEAFTSSITPLVVSSSIISGSFTLFVGSLYFGIIIRRSNKRLRNNLENDSRAIDNKPLDQII